MKLEPTLRFARPFVLVVTVLLLADLFLDWRAASIVTGPVSVDTGASGWGGWGIVAGMLLIAILVWELWDAFAERFEARTTALVGGLLCVAADVFTTVAFFTGSVDVDVANVVSVGIDERQWPAYVGLPLGIVLALTGIVRGLVYRSSPPRLASRTAHHGVT